MSRASMMALSSMMGRQFSEAGRHYKPAAGRWSNGYFAAVRIFPLMGKETGANPTRSPRS